jgi:hypothetical protein
MPLADNRFRRVILNPPKSLAATHRIIDASRDCSVAPRRGWCVTLMTSEYGHNNPIDYNHESIPFQTLISQSGKTPGNIIDSRFLPLYTPYNAKEVRMRVPPRKGAATERRSLNRHTAGKKDQAGRFVSTAWDRAFFVPSKTRSHKLSVQAISAQCILCTQMHNFSL